MGPYLHRAVHLWSYLPFFFPPPPSRSRVRIAYWKKKLRARSGSPLRYVSYRLSCAASIITLFSGCERCQWCFFFFSSLRRYSSLLLSVTWVQCVTGLRCPGRIFRTTRSHTTRGPRKDKTFVIRHAHLLNKIKSIDTNIICRTFAPILSRFHRYPRVGISRFSDSSGQWRIFKMFWRFIVYV